MTRIELYLVRHGETIYNQIGRVQGWKDSPLTEDGRDIALKCGHGLRDLAFDGAYSSDLKRAVHTAEIILEVNHKENIPYVERKALREISFGHFDGGLNQDRIAASAKILLGEANIELLNEKVKLKEIRGRQLLNATHSIDQSGLAETFEEMQGRATKEIERIFREASKNDHKKILVVSHGVTIAAIIDHFPGVRIEQISDIQNASVSKLVLDGESIHVEKAGSMAYVKKGEDILK